MLSQTGASRLESDASHLIVDETEVSERIHLIIDIEVKPKEQSRVSLGNYDKTGSPRGFVIRVNPESEKDAIVTQITRLSLGQNGEYELILHIANYGDRSMGVEISRL